MGLLRSLRRTIESVREGFALYRESGVDKPCKAAVYDTRPIPGDEEQFSPYFIALCECGWVGEPLESSEEAFHDAYPQTQNVDEHIQRPVG